LGALHSGKGGTMDNEPNEYHDVNLYDQPVTHDALGRPQAVTPQYRAYLNSMYTPCGMQLSGGALSEAAAISAANGSIDITDFDLMGSRSSSTGMGTIYNRMGVASSSPVGAMSPDLVGMGSVIGM
jgi:hypothetical protein